MYSRDRTWNDSLYRIVLKNTLFALFWVALLSLFWQKKSNNFVWRNGIRHFRIVTYEHKGVDIKKCFLVKTRVCGCQGSFLVVLDSWWNWQHLSRLLVIWFWLHVTLVWKSCGIVAVMNIGCDLVSGWVTNSEVQASTEYNRNFFASG